MNVRKFFNRSLSPAFIALVLATAPCGGPKTPDVKFLSDAPSAGELKVLANSPQGEEVPVSAEGVTVMFDQPMVPFTTLDKGRDLAIPLTITPSTPGKFFWLGTKGFIFRPEKPFAPSTKYRVELPANLTALSGRKLASPVAWEFSTVRPAVRSFEPASERVLLPRKASFQIDFNVAVDAPTVEKSLRFLQNSSHQPLPTARELSWLNDGHTLQVKFTGELPWEDVITVTVPAGTRGARGDLASREDAVAAYSTPSRELRLEKAFWVDHARDATLEIDLDAEKINELKSGTGVCYRFSQAFVTSSFEKAFHAESDPAGEKIEPFFYYRGYDVFYSGLKNEEGYDDYVDGYKTGCIAFLDKDDLLYKFSLDAGRVEAVSGATAQAGAQTYAVRTLNAEPWLASRLTKPILSAAGDMRIPYRVTNLSSILLNAYRIEDLASYSEDFKSARARGLATHYDAATKTTVTDDPPMMKFDEGVLRVPVVADTMRIDTERLPIYASLSQEITAAPNASTALKLDLAAFEGGKKPLPGIYLLEARGTPLNAGDAEPEAAYSLIQVTPVGLAIKREVDHVLVWATDIDGGTPIVGLPLHVVLDNEDGILAERDVVTGSDGTALIEGTWSTEEYSYGLAACVNVTDPARFSYSCQNMHDVAGYRSVLKPGPNYFAYVYTDRPVYRPGQTVRFSSFIREVKEGRYLLSDNDLLIGVTVRDASGTDIHTASGVIPEAGGVISGSVEIGNDDATPRGQYSVSLNVGGQSFTRDFYVQSYKKPSFKIDVKADTPEIVSGEELKMTVNGAYFFGAPMRKAKARWSIMTTTHIFGPEGFEAYSFLDDDLLHSKDGENGDSEYYGDYEYDTVYSWPISEEDDHYDDPRGAGSTRGGGSFFKTGDGGKAAGVEGRLDDAGALAISYVPDLAKYPTSQVLTVEANVQDPAQQEVSAAGEVIAHKADFYIGVKSGKWAYGEKDMADFDVVSLDTNGKPVGGKDFTADFIRRDYNYIQRRNSSGYWEFTYKHEDKTVQTVTGKTDVSGHAPVNVPIPQGGEYRLVVKSEDARKNPVQSAAQISAWGEGYVTWKLDDKQTLELVPDKDEYRAGDIAHILIKSLLPVTKALVSFERGRMLDYKVMDLGGNATHIDIPILEGMTPNFYLSVLAHVGKNEDHPQLVYHGETELAVNPQSKRLSVAITTDRQGTPDAPPVYRPGDPVKVRLETKDPAGRPVKSHVIVSVADESVLRLLDYQLPDLVEKFYFRRPNEVKTSSSLVSLKAGDGSPGKKKRKLFQDTADFQAHLVTDENGVAEYSFALPDDLTTWVLEAVAISESKTRSQFETETRDSAVPQGSSSLAKPLPLTDGTFVGSQRAKLMTTIPVVMRAALPRFAAWDDELSGKIVLNNRNELAVEGSVTVGLKSGAAFAGGETERKVDFSLSAGEEKAFPLDIVVKTGGDSLTLTADATGKDGADLDALEVTIPVLDRYSPEAVALSGTLSEAAQDKEILDLPKSVETGKGGLDVSFKASLGLAVAGPMRRLVYFPWGCSEQKSATLLALLMARDMTERFGEKYFDTLAPFTKDELKGLAGGFKAKLDFMDDRVYVLLDDLYGKFQSYGGGIRYWPDSRYEDVLPSVQVAWATALARDQGYEIDEGKFSKLANYLVKKSGEAGLAPDVKAFLLWGTAMTGTMNGNLIAELSRDPSRLDAEGLSYLLLAIARYAAAGFSDPGLDAFLAAKAGIVGRLLGFAKQEPRHTSWPASPGFYSSPVKATSLAADALLSADPSNPMPARTMNFLFNRKKTGNANYSTQDDVYLSWFAYEFSRAAREDRTDFTAKAGLAGKTLAEKKFGAENLLEEFEASVPMTDLPVGAPSDLIFDKAGTGTLYYDAVLKYYLPPDQTPPREEGLIIAREYYALDDAKEERPLTAFKAGETYKGRITITAPNDLNYVLVQDLLPAGFEPVDLTLATTSRAAGELANSHGGGGYEDEWYGDFKQPYDDEVPVADYGMGYGFSHQEIRDDAVVWSDEIVPAGTYQLRYPVRASMAGTYLMPGAYAFEFYEPEIFARSRSREITIAPAE